MENVRMLVVFIAGPFRGDSHWDIQTNVYRSRAAGLEVARMGCYPFMPHANTCYFYGTMPEEHWLKGCAEMVARCDLMLVLPGHESSSGTKGEIALAKNLGRPIFYSLSELWCWLKARAEECQGILFEVTHESYEEISTLPKEKTYFLSLPQKEETVAPLPLFKIKPLLKKLLSFYQRNFFSSSAYRTKYTRRTQSRPRRTQ